MSAESAARDALCGTAHSLYARGLTHGSTGNLSIRIDDGWLLSPTGVSLGDLDPARLARLNGDGRHVSGDQPTKESVLHLAMYQQRPGSGAVVHLHSTHAVAVSLMAELDPADLLPPLTAYYIMRVGSLPLVPYYPPGDPALADAVRGFAGKHHAMLLANHGPVVAGSSLAAATDAIEELEATSRLYLLLRGERLRLLTTSQVAELRQRYAS